MSLMLDISGFEAVFRLNYQLLCAASYRIVQDKDIAEDIVQDIIYKLWEKKDALFLGTSLKSHLFKSVVNQSILFVTRFKSPLITEASVEDGLEFVVNEQTRALMGLGKQVDDTVRALPEVERLIFILSRFHKMHFSEISERLKIPVKTVENQLTNALKHLRNGFLSRSFSSRFHEEPNEVYANLLTCYVSGQISLEETDVLLDWIEEDVRNEDLLRDFQQTWDSTKNYPINFRVDVTSGWQRFKSAVKEDHTPAKKDYSSIIKWSILIGGAIFLLACFILGLSYLKII